jgi:hypothetical protein
MDTEIDNDEIEISQDLYLKICSCPCAGVETDAK